MQITVFEDAQELARKSAEALREAIRIKPDLLCCFAAGMTQVPTYAILADWAQSGEVDVSRIRVVGLDEIAGASREAREGFHYFLEKHFFLRAGIRASQIVFFNAQAPDLDAEASHMDAWLDENGPIDFLLLGVGDNGHIGYNEPGARPDGRTHVSHLEQSSIDAGKTYFDHAFSYEKGITLGLRDLLCAREILVQMTGAKKYPVVERLYAGEATPDIPATLLLGRERGVRFFADRSAAGK